jgi:TusA-related sulfurtransferase
MPIVKLSKAFKELPSGVRLEVMADDPAFEPDVQAWCNKTGNKLISLDTDGAGIKAVIEKA